MKFIVVMSLLIFSLAGCSGFEEEVAGICVTCTVPDTPPVVIEACSNGDGTITLSENGSEVGVFEDDTESFRIAQESTGATCN